MQQLLIHQKACQAARILETHPHKEPRRGKRASSVEYVCLSGPAKQVFKEGEQPYRTCQLVKPADRRKLHTCSRRPIPLRTRIFLPTIFLRRRRPARTFVFRRGIPLLESPVSVGPPALVSFAQPSLDSLATETVSSVRLRARGCKQLSDSSIGVIFAKLLS